MAHYPMGTTSANHADLLYFLAPSVSAGQRPFIFIIKISHIAVNQVLSLPLKRRKK
jgi:hypothetical protein